MHLKLGNDHVIHPNGTMKNKHAQVIKILSKLGDLRLFGNVTSRRTTLMLKTFPFEAWIMMNFEVEV